jgi:DNA ligase-1
MKFSEFSDACEQIAGVSSKLKKTEMIAGLLRKSGGDLYMAATLLQGRVFAQSDEREVGIAGQSMERIVAQATGFSQAEIRKRFSKAGDFGLVAQELAGKKKQRTLLSQPLTLKKVFDNLRKAAETEGKGSQERKLGLVAELLSGAGPLEAKYIVRATVGDLRVGVAEGTIRDAIAQAFLLENQNSSDTSPKGSDAKKEAVSAVEWAWFLRPDYGEIAEIAREKGTAGLRKVKVEVGKPYHVLLAERSPGLKEALGSFEHPALEWKYDGARIVIHVKGNKCWFFTRRLENITKQFPELSEMVAKAVAADECIIEGEMLGFNKSTGKPMPFQFLSQRIKRKYDIDRMVKEIPVQVNLFDIVLLDGKELFDEPLHERWRRLKSVVRPIKGKFQLAEHLETRDIKEAEKFYKESLAASQEGLIVKNLDAAYQPGRRVAGGWLKVKPVMETLDLAIIGATWGTGKRAGWFGSFVLGARDPDGSFRNCGMIGTGIKEKTKATAETGRVDGGSDSEDVTFEQLTKILKPNITAQRGSEVSLKPDVLVEVAYEEIQQSPNCESGYALRFPRVLKIRPDKSVDEASTTDQLKRLYAMQKGKIRS